MRTPGRSVAFALAAATGLALFTGVGSAVAAPAAAPTPLPGTYVAPLQFAIGARTYVADSAQSALFRLGKKRPIATGPAPSRNPEASGDLAGVAVNRGSIAYTTTEADHRNTYLTVRKHGQQVFRVDLGAYERKRNPDASVQYGVADTASVSAKCSAQIKKAGAPVQYQGLPDSHPYSVTGTPSGDWLVADAGGNDVLKVTATGEISTLAVLPAQPVTITKAIAAEIKAPACVGITYRFEAVPTDVETGPDGVYVTTLPGGSGGAGSVYRIDGNGQVTLVATGLAAATNLAVAPDGTIYVVQLGQGVFRITQSGPQLVAKVPFAAAVEAARGHLYVSTAPAVLGGKGPGRILKLH